jgi:hypothetical protein
MTTAKLLVRRNTDPWQSGAVVGAVGDHVTLGMQATDGVRSGSVYEIYGSPPSYTMPSGWTDLGDGRWTYPVTGATPELDLTVWGKYMTALRLNGASDLETNLVDFSTAISVLGADGREDVGRFETSQFHEEWSEAYRITMRAIGTSGGPGLDATKWALNGSNSPSADMPVGGNKLTGLANGVNPQDAAAFGQIPTSIDQLSAAFAIASFTPSGTNYASVVEVGTTLSSLTASATYISGPPSAASITDTDSGSWTISGPSFASGTRSGTVQKTANNAYLTVTLSATGPAGAKTSAVTCYWRPKVYHGVAVPGTYNTAFISALATSNLQSTCAVIYTDNATAGTTFYFAPPSSYATPTFWIGGLQYLGIRVAANVPHISNGVTQNYDIWQIVEVLGNGFVTITAALL